MYIVFCYSKNQTNKYKSCHKQPNHNLYILVKIRLVASCDLQ